MNVDALATVPRSTWSAASRRRVAAVRERLAWVHGVPVQVPHRDPLAELVLTLLSQSTNDRNRDVAYLRLVQRLGDWEAVLAAPVAEVEEAIRPGGLARVKSRRIREILEAVAERGPSAAEAAGARAARPLDLDWLGAVPLAEARAFCGSLPGVGRKTTACVLCFAFGRHDVPVDTHVQRVGTRLGLLRPGAGTDELHDEMLRLTPEGAALELHVNVLRHGRRTCAARRPRCGDCALRRMCPHRWS